MVEILSPGDESLAKLGFYFAHDVQEVLLVDPHRCTVEWLTRGDHGFTPATGSTLLDVTAKWLTQAIDWPPLTS